MRIFILEDDPARILHFREVFFRHDLTFADSCAQIDRFKPPYDVIFLDHDLGGRQLEEHEDNGNRFAQLITLPEDLVGGARVIVHSYNAAGARNIAATIKAVAPLGTRHVFLAPFRGAYFDSFVHVINQEVS